MTIWLAIVSLVLGIAVLAATLWKRPDPHHEFMLDLYNRVLRAEPEAFDAASAAHAELADRLRHTGRAG